MVDHNPCYSVSMPGDTSSFLCLSCNEKIEEKRYDCSEFYLKQLIPLVISIRQVSCVCSGNREILGQHDLFHKENDTKAQEYPNISLASIHAATNKFSDSNKLGEGGFGPVYKVVTLFHM